LTHKLLRKNYRGKIILFKKSAIIFLKLKNFIMGSLLYVIAVILIVAWLLGYFAFHVTSGLIHILLVAAVIIFLLKLIGGNRSI
jgi:hypothetical protein